MNGPAINIIGDDKCTGCFACYNSCPKDVIQMELNEEGFYIPIVNDKKCSNCNICQEYCPVIREQSGALSGNKLYKVCAALSTNKTVRLESSSGGIFTELAKFVIKNGGVVFGAAWDENWRVIHIIAKNKDGIANLRGSKYLQSYIGYTYKEILELLKENIKVLFVGTPCQVAALKNFTNDKNLITIDLVCHGVPSIKVFELYIYYLFHGEKITSISFRNKKTGWEKFCIRIETQSGKVYTKRHFLDPFFSGFLKNVYLRRSCYGCPFNKIPRYGDITLGDYWGVPQNLKNEEGVSVVLINSEKGLKIFEKIIESRRITAFETDIGIATKENPRIITGNFSIPDSRESFFRDLGKNGFGALNKKYIKAKSNILIYKISSIKNKVFKKLNIK